MQLTWFGTNQKRRGHQAQHNWPLFGGSYILNLNNAVNWWDKAKWETYGLWTTVVVWIEAKHCHDNFAHFSSNGRTKDFPSTISHTTTIELGVVRSVLLTRDYCTRALFHLALPHRKDNTCSILPRIPSCRQHLGLLLFPWWHTCHSYTTGRQNKGTLWYNKMQRNKIGFFILAVSLTNYFCLVSGVHISTYANYWFFIKVERGG